MSNPVLLIPQDCNHELFSELQTRNLVYELRNTGRIRGIDQASLYACIENEWESFISSKSFGFVEVQAPILNYSLTKQLVNTFEIGIPVLTQKYLVIEWI